MQSLKNQIKAFFNFNKRQERGAFVLIVLIIFAFGIHLLLPKIIKEKAYDFSSTLAEIDEWKERAVENSSLKSLNSKANAYKSLDDELARLKPVPFNPNKFPEEKWLEMGLPSRVVKTILNYEAKGGSFKKKEDLQKIYGLAPEMYAKLADFINIPEKENSNKAQLNNLDSNPIESKTNILLDINRADSVELLQAPGIGPFYAGQIVSYRNRLGGYNSIEQLRELYKMDSSRMQAFLAFLVFKDTTLTQIDVNSADFKTVLRHPYIDYETTKRIFNLRNKLGRFAGMYQLRNDSILPDSLFKKLEPYLKVE